MVNDLRTAVFFHGWAGDKSAWFSLSRLIKADNLRFYDRGYYYNPKAVTEFAPCNTQRIIITHSLGLHFVSQSLLNNCTHLFIISGFTEFHPTNTKQRRRSQMALTKMVARMQTEPAKQLADFYRQSYYPEPPRSFTFTRFNAGLLMSDLHLLDTVQFDLSNLASIPTVQILHGTKDTIVPLVQTEKFSTTNLSIQMHIHESAGHMLPLTQASWCANRINQVLNQSSLSQPISTCRS